MKVNFIFTFNTWLLENLKLHIQLASYSKEQLHSSVVSLKVGISRVCQYIQCLAWCVTCSSS